MRTQQSDSATELVARAERCKARNVCFISLRSLQDQVTVTTNHPVAGTVTFLEKFHIGGSLTSA